MAEGRDVAMAARSRGRARRFAFVLVALSCCEAWSGFARADLSELTADPDHPHFSFAYRGRVRSTVGGTLRLREPASAPDWGVQVTPMVELHEPPGSKQPLPNQYWRGLLGLHVSWDPAPGWRLAWRIHHESDHETSHEFSQPGFLTLNHVGVGLRREAAWGAGAWSFLVQPRVYFASCTRVSRECPNFGGSPGFGGQLGGQLESGPWNRRGLKGFASLYAGGIVGSGALRDEIRGVLRAGIARELHGDTASIYALGWWGNDVGIQRHRRVYQAGIGMAWAM